MRERPIIFSGPMVRAVLAGTKTQTRRLVWSRDGARRMLATQVSALATGVEWWVEPFGWELCPYGAPGDALWCRETWAQADREGGPVIVYRAGGYLMHGATGSKRGGTWKDETFRGDAGTVYEPECWRPSIFMPRWASRLTLEVAEVRVQRLQEINEEDARAEGVPPYESAEGDGGASEGPAWYRIGYSDLWDSINGKRAPWDSNPWVWCISFRRIQ